MISARFRRPLAVAAVLFAAGAGPSTARGQFFDQPGQEFVVTPGSTIVGPASVVSSTPIVRATPRMTRQERRELRRQGRYQTMRPTYDSGKGLTFAPFSDRYYPRTIYSRDVPGPVATPQPTITTITPR